MAPGIAVKHVQPERRGHIRAEQTVNIFDPPCARAHRARHDPFRDRGGKLVRHKRRQAQRTAVAHLRIRKIYLVEEFERFFENSVRKHKFRRAPVFAVRALRAGVGIRAIGVRHFSRGAIPIENSALPPRTAFSVRAGGSVSAATALRLSELSSDAPNTMRRPSQVQRIQVKIRCRRALKEKLSLFLR